GFLRRSVRRSGRRASLEAGGTLVEHTKRSGNAGFQERGVLEKLLPKSLPRAAFVPLSCMAMRRLPCPDCSRQHGTRDGRQIDSRRRDCPQERIGNRRQRDLPERQAKPAPGSDSERVDQRLKRRRLMASARVIQEV